ncbi:UBA/TS-N domain-containing protein [Phytophthora infestans]|uniref:UBA/TS-N domain-containing protein n=1 Tax=Phytophthora infestans TaxID=4787 RepID=A0A8S9UQN7_PHYIN|nr:UBA/TS-N domain-containing protein [Phytophthora infestans]
MLVLRVRCADDGRELLVERHGPGEHSVRVVELKRLILQQRQQLYRSGDAAIFSHPPIADLEDCFVLLRGQILADPDVVDLNALKESDFFVFAPDSPLPGTKPSSSNEMQVDSPTFDLLRSQLVDMGFSTELAAQALRQSGNNLLNAAALLAEGKMSTEFGQHESINDDNVDLMTQHPSVAPLRSLLHDKNVRKLREVAATDSFQALLLLKESFSSETLNQLNENPVATLRLLSLPVPVSSSMATEMKPFGDAVIDVDDLNMDTTASDSKGAVDRLVAMGFAQDLVEIMYESCGGDEQLTANALLQTLES